MSSSTNGRPGNHRDPTRRLRHDDLASVIAQTYAPRPGRPATGDDADRLSPWLPRSHSGRRFVIMAGIAVLLIWGVLYLVFREWRARYRERAAYGVSQVVPAIDPMGDILPPDVNPASWRDAVRQTHAMLLTVTASNLLDIVEMRALARRARPGRGPGPGPTRDGRRRTGRRVECHRRPRRIPVEG